MPQSPKQRLSPAQEGLFRKETWEISLHQRAAPAAGHGGTGDAPFSPAAHSTWWAGGGSGCKEQQQSTSVNGWHTHMFAHIRLVWMQLLSDNKVVKGQMLWVCRTDVFQMAHPRQKYTSATASLWSLKTTNGVQSPEFLCASNGGWQEKPGLSTPPEGKKKRPTLTYINPSHKMTFSFVTLQKDF